MKKIMKALSAVSLSALLAVTAVVPSIVPVTKAEAAPSPIVKYDFENGTGMSSSGIAGAKAPTVVTDSERGKVLQFEDGTSSKVVQMKDDPSLGEYDMKISNGTPSSLSFPNPFSGKSLSGVTISYWLKITSDKAIKDGSGIVGFVSESKTIVHPDKIIAQSKGDNNKDGLSDAHGPFAYGVTCAYADDMAVEELPMVYFVGLHHNTYNFNEKENSLSDKIGQWVFVTVTQDNSDANVYVNGKAVEADKIKNKRWNDGEKNGGTEGNVGQPKFTDIITEAGTKAYVGFTGFSPTVAGTCIDDLMFFDSALSASDVTALYTAAQSGAITSGNGGSGSGSGSGSQTTSSSSSEDKKKAAAEAAAKAAAEAAAKEAEAVAANKALTDSLVSSLKVTGMKDATPKVAGIYRGTDAYKGLLDTLCKVTIRPNYGIANFIGFDVYFDGAQPETVATLSFAVPNGFDPSLVEIVRINDDGTVTKLKSTVENGVIKAKTNHFSTYAVVLLQVGEGRNKDLFPTGAASTAAVAGFGVVIVACGAVLYFKKRKVEA